MAEWRTSAEHKYLERRSCDARAEPLRKAGRGGGCRDRNTARGVRVGNGARGTPFATVGGEGARSQPGTPGRHRLGAKGRVLQGHRPPGAGWRPPCGRVGGRGPQDGARVGAGPAGSGAGVAHAQREGAEGGDGGVPIPRGWTLPCRMACGSGDEARGISGEEWWGWARGGHGGWVGVVPVPRCPVGNVGPVACGVEMVQPGSILAPQTAQCSLIPLPCLRSPLPRTV